MAQFLNCRLKLREKCNQLVLHCNVDSNENCDLDQGIDISQIRKQLCIIDSTFAEQIVEELLVDRCKSVCWHN